METASNPAGKPIVGKLTPEMLEMRAVRQSKREKNRLRESQVMQLRLAGADYTMIAEVLGYANRSGPWKVVQKLLANSIREAAEEIVDIELARLDYMLRQLWPMIMNDPEANPPKIPDLGAFDRVLRIMDKRAKYLRLDKPVEDDVEGIIAELAKVLDLDEDEQAMAVSGVTTLLDFEKKKAAREKARTG